MVPAVDLFCLSFCAAPDISRWGQGTIGEEMLMCPLDGREGICFLSVPCLFSPSSCPWMDTTIQCSQLLHQGVLQTPDRRGGLHGHSACLPVSGVASLLCSRYIPSGTGEWREILCAVAGSGRVMNPVKSLLSMFQAPKSGRGSGPFPSLCDLCIRSRVSPGSEMSMWGDTES